MIGTIIYGINGFFYVNYDGKIYESKIKGKILGIEKEYNPLIAGDCVSFDIVDEEKKKGLILSREVRHNSLLRFNKKNSTPQTIGANFDLLVIVSSVKSPEFRPRFIDRIIATAPTNTEIIIVLNKVDLGVDDDVKERLDYFKKIGYNYYMVSTKTNEGLEVFKNYLSKKRSLFTGQSGVGKSSLINCLDESIKQRVGDVSQKFNKGTHTTNFAKLLFLKDDIEIIDSPGIREIEVYGIEPEDLHYHFVDFFKLSKNCFYNGCKHIDEPNCAVKKAVEENIINQDRYYSYLNLYQNLIERRDY